MEINTKGQDNVAIDKEVLAIRDYNTNKIVEKLLNTITRVDVTDALSTMLRLLGEELQEASWLIQA